MTINKYQGKTKEEAIEKAKQELGENAVIMNVKEVKPKGVFKAFKSSNYEVTAALEEKESFANPFNTLKNVNKQHESINLAADEKIEIPVMDEQKAEDRTSGDKTAMVSDLLQKEILQAKEELNQDTVKDSVNVESPKRKRFTGENGEPDIEKRIENLSNMLDQKVTSQKDFTEISKKATEEELNFVKILYNTLLTNEVNEQYVNQILDEVERFIRPGNSLDLILSNVYQKLILRFGQPNPIGLTGKKPKVVFFIGPTGVGKTTTIAKIASKYKVEHDRKITFFTADTYRIAATEQLRVYANILDAPMSIIYSPEEMNEAIAGAADSDLIFVDTAGFSHRNEEQRNDIKKLIDSVSTEYEKEVYLVLSATTKYKDLLEITKSYHKISDYKLIFTKLDETSTYGNILNVKLYSGADLSYVTNGQNVPDDIEIFDTQKIVKQLLGGR